MVWGAMTNAGVSILDRITLKYLMFCSNLQTLEAVLVRIVVYTLNFC